MRYALLLLACQEPLTARETAAVLQAVALDPSAVGTCRSIPDAALKADCVSLAVEQMARRDAKQARAWCDVLDLGVGREECIFQVAERINDREMCSEAGKFKENCLAHVWAHEIDAMFPTEISPPEAELIAADGMRRFGLAPESEGPWVEVFRHILDIPGTMQRGRCDGMGNPKLITTCRETARDLFADRAEQAVRNGQVKCGVPVRAELDPGGDPELDEILGRHLQSLGCGPPPGPPPGTPPGSPVGPPSGSPDGPPQGPPLHGPPPPSPPGQPPGGPPPPSEASGRGAVLPRLGE